MTFDDLDDLNFINQVITEMTTTIMFLLLLLFSCDVFVSCLFISVHLVSTFNKHLSNNNSKKNVKLKCCNYVIKFKLIKLRHILAKLQKDLMSRTMLDVSVPMVLTISSFKKVN